MLRIRKWAKLLEYDDELNTSVIKEMQIAGVTKICFTYNSSDFFLIHKQDIVVVTLFNGMTEAQVSRLKQRELLEWLLEDVVANRHVEEPAT